MPLSASNITHQAPGTSGATTATSHTITFGWTATAGRTLLLWVGSTAVISTPSGWTADKNQTNNDDHRAFRKTAAGGETGVTVTLSTSRTAAWVVMEVTGLASTQPDVAPAS